MVGDHSRCGFYTKQNKQVNIHIHVPDRLTVPVASISVLILSLDPTI